VFVFPLIWIARSVTLYLSSLRRAPRTKADIKGKTPERPADVDVEMNSREDASPTRQRSVNEYYESGLSDTTPADPEEQLRVHEGNQFDLKTLHATRERPRTL
jgi:hypothetical protein